MLWSKSQLQTYDHCPKRFEYENIERAKEGESGAGTDALSRGTIFHDTAEKIYSRLDYQLLHSLTDRDKIIDHIRSKMYPTDDYYVEELYDNFAIIEADRWIYTRQVKGRDADLYFKPVVSEKEVVNHKYSIRGKIDWIFRNFDDGYIIGEIKTGKRYEDAEIRKELCFLTMLCEGMDILDEPPKYIMCYYPRINFVFFEKPKPQSVAAMKRMWERGKKGLAAQDFHMTIGTLCNWCPFVDKCQENWDVSDWTSFDEKKGTLRNG